MLGATVLAGLALVAGCTVSGTDPNEPPPTPGQATLDPDSIERVAFAAATLRVHPLTHIDPLAGPKGDQVLLMLHIELRDRYGEQVRDLGILRAEFTVPGQAPLSWDVPEMIGADQNMKRYDPSTRTYRLGLTLPPTMRTVREGTVRVSYNMPQIQRTLTHTYTIQAPTR